MEKPLSRTEAPVVSHAARLHAGTIRIIQVALNDAVVHTYVETEAKNPPVMQEMKEKHGVTNRRWSDDDLLKLVPR